MFETFLKVCSQICIIIIIIIIILQILLHDVKQQLYLKNNNIVKILKFL